MHLRLTLPQMDGGTWDGRKEGEVVRQTWSKSLTGLAEMRGREGEKESEISPTHHARLGADSMCLHLPFHTVTRVSDHKKLPISLQRSVNSLQPKEKWTADRVLRECNDAWLIMMSNSK